ncbi:hypothetical protein QIG69_28500, partial [Klebsiella pneumoniae]|nr:hypothetical protein [Klebsiella pneumoniae]
MLALPLPESEVSEMLDPDLRLAAVNGPCSSVVAGTIPAIEALETHLAQKQVIARRLHTSHAFHS